MANFTQSLSDSIRFFGIQPSTKYGSPMKWGTDLWGNGGNTNFNMPTASRTLQTELSPVLTDAFITGFSLNAILNDNLSMVQGSGQIESLTDRQGYKMVFHGISTNDENVTLPDYQTSTVGTTWTRQTATSGGWS